MSLGTCTSDDTSAWCDHPDACSGSFGLHDLAVLAASLEHLVHDDVIARLQGVFEVHDLPLTTRVDEALVDQAIDTDRLVYIQSSNLTGMTPHDRCAGSCLTTRSCANQTQHVISAWSITSWESLLPCWPKNDSLFLLQVRSRDKCDVNRNVSIDVRVRNLTRFPSLEDQLVCLQEANFFLDLETHGRRDG